MKAMPRKANFVDEENSSEKVAEQGNLVNHEDNVPQSVSID